MVIKTVFAFQSLESKIQKLEKWTSNQIIFTHTLSDIEHIFHTKLPIQTQVQLPADFTEKSYSYLVQSSGDVCGLCAWKAL